MLIPSLHSAFAPSLRFPDRPRNSLSISYYRMVIFICTDGHSCSSPLLSFATSHSLSHIARFRPASTSFLASSVLYIYGSLGAYSPQVSLASTCSCPTHLSAIRLRIIHQNAVATQRPTARGLVSCQRGRNAVSLRCQARWTVRSKTLVSWNLWKRTGYHGLAFPVRGVEAS